MSAGLKAAEVEQLKQAGWTLRPFSQRVWKAPRDIEEARHQRFFSAKEALETLQASH